MGMPLQKTTMAECLAWQEEQPARHVFYRVEIIVTGPKLVIKVLSPSSKGYGRLGEFILCRSLPALRHYALNDPDRRVGVHTPAGEDTWTLFDQGKAAQITLSRVDLAMPIQAVFNVVEHTA